MPTLDVAINALRAKHGAKQFDEAVKKIKRGSKDVDKSIKKNEKSFLNFSKGTKNIAVGLIAMGVAYKAFRFAISSVKEFAAFEMGLANVSTMLDDATMKYMPEYERQLKKMAIEFGQSTDTLSKGLYDILSASVSADEAIEVLRVSSKAAIAGLTDTGIAADALTTILNSYGLEAKEATRIGDILFATVKGGKITFGELAGSIGKVASLAAAVGLEFTEVSGAIATMTRNGVQSDIAMTSLRAILVTFLQPQADAVKIAKKFNLVLNANTIRTIGLTGVLEKLTDATEEEIAGIFKNQRALVGIAPLRGNLTALIEDQEKATDSLGKQEEAYGKIIDKTGIKLKRMAESWKSLKVAAGEGGASAIDNLSNAMVQMGPIIGGLVRHIGNDIPDAVTEMYFQTELARKKLLSAFARIDLTGVLDDEALKREIKSLEKIVKSVQGVTKVQKELADITEDVAKSFERMEAVVKDTASHFETWGAAQDFLLGLSDSAVVTAQSIYGIIPASEEFTDVLTKLNEEITAVRIETEDFGKTDIEKQVAQFGRLEEALSSPSEILKYREEVKKLEEVLIELGELEKAVEKTKTKGEVLEYLDDQAQAYRRLYDDIGESNSVSYNNKIKLLDREREKYEVFIKDKVLLDEWYTERKRELDRQRAIESQNFFAGFSSEVDNIKNDLKTLGEAGSETALIMKEGMSDYFMTIGQEGSNWKEAMEGIFLSVLGSFQRMVADMIAEQMMSAIMKPAMNWLGMGLSAVVGGLIGGGGSVTPDPSGGSFLGADFSAGAKGMTIKRMAKGDILSGATLFPMENGGIALGGEAGKEALMPLGRDSQGRLGVNVAGTGESSKTPIKIINVLDSSMYEEYLGTGDGERTVLNILRRNANEVMEIVG